MGLYRFTLEAVGGSGCQREIKTGGKVYGCGQRMCPDCELRELVQNLQQRGQTVKVAVLEHWPDLPERTVVDDLMTRTRKGQF